jgi:hypothetical protein
VHVHVRARWKIECIVRQELDRGSSAVRENGGGDAVVVSYGLRSMVHDVRMWSLERTGGGKRASSGWRMSILAGEDNYCEKLGNSQFTY